MRNIGIRYYKMGLYNEEQFALFVKRGFVTEEEFKELTGVEYDPEKHMHRIYQELTQSVGFYFTIKEM